MTHLLTLNYRGAGTPAVVRMVNGLSQDTTNLGTLPGATVDTTDAASADLHTSNRVLQMGHRIFAFVGTDVFQKDGAGAFVAQGLSITLISNREHERSGPQPFMDPDNGPGWFSLYVSTGNTFYVLKYDFLTDTYSTLNLGVVANSGSNFFSDISNFAQLGDEFIGIGGGGYTSYNPISDAITTVTVPFGGGRQGGTSAKGNVYVAGQFDNANFSDAELRVLLGGTYAAVATLTDTSCRERKFECQPLVYERNGDVWICVPRNDNPSGYDTNGMRLFKWDTTLNVLTDESASVLHPLLRQNGGLSQGTGTGEEGYWRMYHHKVVESPFGSERILIRVQLGAVNQGSVLFEHTAGGWALVGSSQWTGFLAPVHNPYGDSGFFWSSGEMSALMTAKATPVSGGVRLDFRAFGDPTFADKVARVYYSDSPGAPFTLAQLANPVGGTGGSSVLVGNALTNVDANGESGGPTTYSVVHETLAQGIPSSADVHWFIEMNTA